MKTIKFLEAFKPLLNTKYTYYCFYGGRGGGKTENIALALVILAMQSKHRILCVREVYRTIRESVRQAIIDVINEMEAEHLFEITKNSIKYKVNNSEFLFVGMGDTFKSRIKSIKGINITWIEEASDISERSWLTLLPSVMRTPHAKMIVSFNPLNEDDIVYKQFVSGTPPINSFIKKVSYKDNPFFKESPLEEQRQHQLNTLPFQLYQHIWEGEILKHIANALFSEETLNNIYDDKVTYGDIVKVVIACDPASTNKEHSNEYGIIAMGRLKGGGIIALKDYSRCVTPAEFAIVVSRAYNEYLKICYDVSVVVETNQGGDFIKHTLLSNNPTLRIVEVRAGVDKIQRALPIANLCSLGKVKLDRAQDFNKLIRQMKLITHNGYLGIKGESPDRLDAFVWGVYYLADLKSFNTQLTYYKREFFIPNKEFSFSEADNVFIGYIVSNEIYGLRFDLKSNANTKRGAIIRDSLVLYNRGELLEYLQENNCNFVLMPNNELSHTLNLDCTLYDVKRDEELVKENYNLISEGIVMFDEDMPTQKHNTSIGQLVVLATEKYSKDDKKISPFVLLINYLAQQLGSFI